MFKKIRKNIGFFQRYFTGEKEELGPTEEDYKEARRLAEELMAKLPKEFTLNGRAYPDLHFVMDPKIPGLYRAKVDESRWRMNPRGESHKKPDSLLVRILARLGNYS